MKKGVEPRLVTRLAIRQFAAAIGSRDPRYYDVAVARQRGYRDLVAPPFFFTTFGLSWGRLRLATDLRLDGMPADDELPGRIVAGGSTIEWHHPFVAGDEVNVEQALTGQETKAGRGGPLTMYHYRRVYRTGDEVAVVERYTRIAR
jgi:acyl dehydratase